MKIAFLGTPAFAVPSLQALIDAGHTLCVFSQPDRPARPAWHGRADAGEGARARARHPGAPV